MTTFLGRFLDAIGTSPSRAPVRTMYAEGLLDRPDLDAIYAKLGGGIVGKYVRSTFPSGPLVFPYPGTVTRSGKTETLVRPDAMLNVDIASGWSRGNADAFGQNILAGFDVDDQGQVLAAATVFGWGITDVQLRPIFHSAAESPSKIIALKGSRPYAVLNGARGGLVYDYSTVRAPVKLTRAIGVPNILQWAKTADASRVAIIDDRMSALRIWIADDLASGAKPLFTQGGYSNVTTDGTNFFALKGNSIDVIEPEVLNGTGSGYIITGNYPLDPALIQVSRIQYGSGFIVVSGGVAVGTGWAWRLYAVSPSLALTPVAIDVIATLSVVGMNAVGGVVIGDRLVLSGGVVGDVYQLEAVTPPVVIPPTIQPPTITDLGPISGGASGGQRVTITGEHLAGATVNVADTLTGVIITNTDTQIVFAMPVGQVGGANIRVTTAGGTAVRWNGYTYTAAAPPDVDQGRVVNVQAREFPSVEKADAWLKANPNAVSFPRWTASNGRTVIFTYT